MTGVIVVLPKIEDAKSMKNLLVRNGVSVLGVFTTGAQAIAMTDGLNDGIVLCGYRLRDMIYTELKECLPEGFEILLLTSKNTISSLGEAGVMCLSMPVKVQDLVSTVNMMAGNIEKRRRKLRARPRERSQEETELIRQAKEILMNRNHMTEEEAHRYLQKCSMDSGTGMTETAQMVLAMMDR